MSKFLLFAGEEKGSGGGFRDFEGDFESVEEAQKFTEEKFPKECMFWAHIVDRETLEIVSSGYTTSMVFQNWVWNKDDL